MSKLTADTITDEQIRGLLDDRDPTHPQLSITDRAWCIAALRIPVGKLAKVKRAEARARCAEILNARAEADLGIGAHVVGTLDTGGELRGEIVALVGRLATVRTAEGRTFTRSLNELTRAEAK